MAAKLPKNKILHSTLFTKIFTIGCGICTLFGAPAIAQLAIDEPGHVQGEVVVQFGEVPTDDLKGQLRGEFPAIMGWRTVRHAPHYLNDANSPHPLAFYQIALVDKSLDEVELAKTMAGSAILQSAEPNLYVTLAFVPNDPRYGEQYGPQITGTEQAWDIEKGDSNVIVAIADTGIYFNQEDLKDGIWQNVDDPVNGLDDDNNGFIDDWRGWDFYYHDNDPSDGNSHGTHVAGTAAARTDNGKGVAGMAQVQIMPLQIWNESGSSDGTFVGYAEAVSYATDNGAHVVNVSGGRSGGAQILADAVKYAWDNGTSVVAAAHNHGSSTKIYPAAYPEVIAIAATDENDVRPSWSNFGTWIDVAAPGVNVISCGMSTSSYTYKSGTSMASPHTAGLVALMYSVDQSISPQEVRDLLRNNAKDLGDPGFDIYYGWGRIDAAATIQAMSAPTCLDLTVDQLIAGQESNWTVFSDSEGEKVALVYGFNDTPQVIVNQFGFCATFGFNGITPNRQVGPARQIFAGQATFTKTIPANLAGLEIKFQAAQKDTCPDECVSNVLDEVIQ